MITVSSDANTILLLHGESLLDGSGSGTALTNNGAAVSSTQYKFGKSLYFDGSSNITLPPIDFGSGNFTIDWWEYVTSSSSSSRFCSCYSPLQSGYGGILLGYQGTKVYASSSTGSSWDLVKGVAMLSNTLNTWVHWAFVRNGTVLTSYRNGVQFAQTEINGAIGHNSQIDAVIADYRTGDHSYFAGYIDEFRISNVARWTSSFTPPTAPYIVMSITITDTEGGSINPDFAMRRMSMVTPKAVGYTRTINTNEPTYTQTIHTVTTTNTITTNTATPTYSNTSNTAGTTYSESYYSSYGSGNSRTTNGKSSNCTQNTMRNASRTGNNQCSCYTVYGSDNSNTSYSSYGSGYGETSYKNAVTDSRTVYTAGTSYTQTSNTAGTDYTRTTYTAGTNYTES